MITLEWMLVARGVSIDRESGSMTIFGVINAIRGEGFPIFVQHLTIAGLLRRKPSDAKRATVKLVISHGGQDIFEGDMAVDFQDKLNNQFTMNFQGLVVPGPGDVEFELKIGSRTLGTYSLAVAGVAAAVVGTVNRDSAASSSIGTAAPKKTGAPKKKSLGRRARRTSRKGSGA